MLITEKTKQSNILECSISWDKTMEDINIKAGYMTASLTGWLLKMLLFFLGYLIYLEILTPILSYSSNTLEEKEIIFIIFLLGLKKVANKKNKL